jgi:hypothetical protein
VVYLDKV